MYLGDLGVGSIIFHARWGIGRVSRRDETCVIVKCGTRRHKMAYNEKVAVWSIPVAAAAVAVYPAALAA
jgi:hypothetical protein